MGFSPLISRRVITTDSSPRTRKIDRFIVHHAATTSLAAILELFQPGGRTVSANYALGSDGELVGTVDEDRRAWTSSAESWDGRAVTIEVANSRAADPWPVSDAAFDKLARLIADVSLRHGFEITDDTVLTHQELYARYGASYATACPGDLQRRKPELLALARKYRTTPTHIPTQAASAEEEEDEMNVRQVHCKEEGRILRALHVPGTAYFVPWTERSSTYANGFAKHWETGDSVEVTPSLFHALRRGAESLLPVDRFQVEIVAAE